MIDRLAHDRIVKDCGVRWPVDRRDFRPKSIAGDQGLEDRDEGLYRFASSVEMMNPMDCPAFSSASSTDSAESSAVSNPAIDIGESRRPKIIVVGPDDALRDAVMDHLRGIGFEIVGCECEAGNEVCTGINTDGADQHIADDDVIFFSFREVSPQRREAFMTMRQRHPKNPVVVELLQPRTFRYADLLRGTYLVVAPVSRDALRETVLKAWSAPNPIIETLRR